MIEIAFSSMSLNSMYFKQMIRPPQCILKMMTSILNILCQIQTTTSQNK